jgi:hypothetical protein
VIVLYGIETAFTFDFMRSGTPVTNRPKTARTGRIDRLLAGIGGSAMGHARDLSRTGLVPRLGAPAAGPSAGPGAAVAQPVASPVACLHRPAASAGFPRGRAAHAGRGCAGSICRVAFRPARWLARRGVAGARHCLGALCGAAISLAIAQTAAWALGRQHALVL